MGHACGQESQAVRSRGGSRVVGPRGRCTGGSRAERWGLLCKASGASLGVGVLLGELLIDIIDPLTEGCKVIKGVSGAAIDGDVAGDASSEPPFKVDSGPFHIDDVFTDLGNNSYDIRG